jgi:hypothetical protein
MILKERRTNPMKKFVRSIALTLAAVLVFGMTVFAATSTETTNTSFSDVEQKLFDDAIAISYATKTDGVTVGPVSADWLTRAKEYVATHPNVIKGEVLTVVDFRSAGAATVTFNTKYFTGEGPFYVLHYYAKDWETGAYDKEAWELIPVTKNADGTFSFTCNSFSPFALITGTAGSAVVAPKTGEVIAISAILALIMMAGVVVCAKKARLQK